MVLEYSKVRSIYFSTRHILHKTNNIKQWCWKMLKAEMVFTYHHIVCQYLPPIHLCHVGEYPYFHLVGWIFSMPQIGPSFRGAISPGCAKDHFYWCWPGREFFDRFFLRLQRCCFFCCWGGGWWLGWGWWNLWWYLGDILANLKRLVASVFPQIDCLRNMYNVGGIYGMCKYIQIHIIYMTVST